MDLTIGQVRALLAIGEHGSFTRAAGELGLTQSAVSRTIAALERLLGGQLVHRGPEGAALTALGREVAGHGHAAVGHLRAIEALAHRPEAPRLRIGAVASALVHLVPAALAEWPDLDALTVVGDDDELAEWFTDSTVDLAVSTTRIPGSKPISTLTDEFLAVLPRRHRLGRASRIALADLVRAGVADPGGTCGPLLTAAFAEEGVTWAPDHTVRDAATVFAMVAAGITAGVVPALAVPRPAPDGVVVRALDPPVHRTLHVHADRRSPSARKLAALLGTAR
ncbi:LysR family transcriptional regulator [Amycolatopsis sp. CA-230715]|uniref:LysR family transcriptional regulator n=1 Tax=Amycolatopsis sp. CA-230715 TaxID=2745196 RepID=UPI001C0098D9|nr:LysR family transcriptional regulator [Amycolatopsis sp. CA-230715]